MTDSTRSYWATWHDDYDDSESDLSQRLIAIQHRLADAITRAPPGAIRVISACAGQGQDVIGVLKSHPRASDVQALLVESDDHNVGVARHRIAAAGITGVDVLRADAGVTGTYRDAAPADVLLLCGIFGIINDEDVRTTVRNASRLCAPRATVSWSVTGATPIEPARYESGSPMQGTRNSRSTRLDLTGSRWGRSAWWRGPSVTGLICVYSRSGKNERRSSASRCRVMTATGGHGGRARPREHQRAASMPGPRSRLRPSVRKGRR